MSVSGDSVTEATISSLMSSTTYSIQVAAVNSAGTGPYSFALDAMTDGKQMDLRHCSVFSVCQAHMYENTGRAWVLFSVDVHADEQIYKCCAIVDYHPVTVCSKINDDFS